MSVKEIKKELWEMKVAAESQNTGRGLLVVGK